jgi:tetratricopeptide (TPR) repeat protein
MKIRDSAVLLLSLGLAFAPLRVSAQAAAAPAGDEKAANLKRAEELYRNGERLYTEGSYESAILAFQESYELSKEPQLLYNIGNAYERLGDFANSRRYLDQYRAFAPEKEREALSRRIQTLDQRQREKEQKEREAAAANQQNPPRIRRPRRSPAPSPSRRTTSPRPRRTASTGPRPSPSPRASSSVSGFWSASA